jgi:hypothetical protein
MRSFRCARGDGDELLKDYTDCAVGGFAGVVERHLGTVNQGVEVVFVITQLSDAG